MVEFALVAPVLFLVIFGVFEFGLLTFDLASSKFANSEAAKSVAQAGTSTPLCSSVNGCPKVYGNAVGLTCDADCQAISAINLTALGTTALEQVNEIDMYQLKSDGTYARAGPVQKYSLNGNVQSGNYPASGRDTQLGSSDFVEVDIVFTYNPLTGLFQNVVGHPQLTTSYIVRLEPQRY